LTPKQKTYGLIFFIALVVSVLLYYFVLLEFLPKIEIQDLVTANSPKEFSSVFYDLDDDNDKEIITFGVDSGDSSIYFFTVVKADGNYIGQFNFRPTNMRINWLGYSDLNNDNKKEIIAFYEKKRCNLHFNY